MELTKVYVVQADNGEEYFIHWTEGVFASEESAKKYIASEEKRYREDMQRRHELELLRYLRHVEGTYDSFEKYGWTAEEYDEYEELTNYWESRSWECCPRYSIREFELKS